MQLIPPLPYFPNSSLAPSPLPMSACGWVPWGDVSSYLQPSVLPYPPFPPAPAPPFMAPPPWRRAPQPTTGFRRAPQPQSSRRMSFNAEGHFINRPPPSQPLYRPSYNRGKPIALSPHAKPFIPRHGRVKGPTRSTRTRRGHINSRVNRIGPLDFNSGGSVSSLSDCMPATPQGFLEIGRDPHQFGHHPVSLINEEYSTPFNAVSNGDATPAMIGRPIGVLPYAHSPRAPRRTRPSRIQPAPVVLGTRMPVREPSPGLFLHHNPPRGVPRHSAYRSDGHTGLEELPLPPMRVTPHGDIEYLSWRMAHQWGLYSPDLNFFSHSNREFWRRVGEDPGLHGFEPVNQGPPRPPYIVPSVPRADVAKHETQPIARQNRQTPSVPSDHAVSRTTPCGTSSVSSIEVVDADEVLGKETDGSTPRAAFLPCGRPADPDVSIDSESSYVMDDVPELSDGSTMTDDSDDERAGPFRRRRSLA